MLSTIEQFEVIREQYERIASWADGVGSHKYAARIRDLLQTSSETSEAVATIAFCGLFSAGKSSLINKLTETGELATGAVPTTAEVAAVRMTSSGKSVALLDTPGVDSTDDRHREATMDALYRADAVVIVADYQHVEAEENLEMLQMFVDEGKPIAFVVNQIDKHLEMELPFVQFAQSIEDVLADYGLDATQIFYTSTLDTSHNQIQSLRDWLLDLASNGAGSDGQIGLKKKLFDVAREAVLDHASKELDQTSARVAELFDFVPHSDEEATRFLQEARVESDRVAALWSQAAQEDEQRRQAIREKWMRLVELAQIAPYETTEKGRVYIESLSPDFKVGFLGARKKTEEERERRAKAFADELNERTQNYLLVPLRNQVADDIRREAVQDSNSVQALVDQTFAISVSVDSAFVEQQVKMGALVSSQYPYQYVKDVVARIKRSVLGQLTPVTDAWMALSQRSFEAAHELARDEVERAAARYQAISEFIDVRRRVWETLDLVAVGEVPFA